MASSQQQRLPPHPLPPSATSTSPPNSTTTTGTGSTITTSNNQASSTTSPPPGAPSTTTSSLSSPQFPPGAHIHPPTHAPHHGPPSTTQSLISPSLPPTSSSERQISEARQAVLASIGNMLDSSLRDRASVLHSNAAAIAKQERDVAKATDGLRRENDKLAKVAGDAAKKVKELGNVQNWAEVLESDFMALEETLRLVREGSEGSWSGSETGSEWSGSRSGDDGERERDGREEGDGDVRMDGIEQGEEGRIGKVDKGKGREVDLVQDDRMDVDGEAGPSGQSGLGFGGDTTVDGLDGHLPPMRSIERDAPSIKVPGLEPSQTSTISLEDELRIAMDQPIGSAA